MPATAKITADTSDYEQKIAAVKAKTVNASQEMSRAVDKFGKDVAKAGGVVSSVSSEISGSLGQVGKVISSVASGPVAILSAAIGGLAAIGMKVWDQLTTSAEEYRAKMEAQIGIEEKRLAKMREQHTEEASYMERLNELAKKERLSNEEKTEAAFLLQTLSGRYSAFSASIDTATGKITGLAEAERKLNEEQRNRRMAALQSEIQSGTTLSNAAFRTQTELPDWLKYTRGWLTGENANAEEAYKAYSGMTLKGRRETALEAIDPENGVRTKEELQFWQEELARLEKLIAAEEELNNLRNFGKGTIKERAGELEEESKKIESIENSLESFFNDVDDMAEQAAQKVLDAELDAQRKQYEGYQQMIQKEAEAEKKLLEEKEKQTKSWNEYRGNSARSMIDQALRLGGHADQAELESMLYSATKAKGSALTDDERSQIIQLAAMKTQINGLSGLSVQDFTPRVNSLIARGGSDAPVSMPKIEDLQAQTLTNVKTIRELAAKFLTAAEAWGTF